MSFATGFIVIIVIELLVVGSLIGYLVLSLSISRKSKRYRALIRDLKKQNKYKEWAEQHKSLVMIDRVIQYSGVLFLLALLIFVGSVREVISPPRILSLASGILVNVFWPFSFVLLMVLSRLYKKIPEVWNESK